MNGCLVIAGSRSLSGSGPASKVERAIRFAKKRGLVVFTGCARGADELAASAALAVGVGVRVFCAGGAWRGGSPAGAALVVWAGGPVTVPAPARLARRTAACLEAAGSKGCAGVFVFFAAAPAAGGSLLTCRLAVALGLPLVVWGLHEGALPPLGLGEWNPAGSWPGFWRWSPLLSVPASPSPPPAALTPADRPPD
jgi:hypothetical protein